MNQQEIEVLEKSFSKVPPEIAELSQKELAVILHGFVCKAMVIEMEWVSRESFAKKLVPTNSECPLLAKLYCALEDYRHLAVFDDCRHQIDSVGGVNGENGGCVYVVEFSDGHIKIGNSINPQQRIKAIAGGNQAEMVRSWISARGRNFAKLERAAHNHFKAFRVGGEFFTAKFEDAVEWVAGEWAKYQLRSAA